MKMDVERSGSSSGLSPIFMVHWKKQETFTTLMFDLSSLSVYLRDALYGSEMADVATRWNIE